MADNFDTLSIQITASASRAITQVNKLADALAKLNGALKGVDSSGLEKAGNAARQFGEVASSFKSTRKNVENMSRAFQQVGQASGNIAKTTDSMQGLANAAKDAGASTEKAAKSAGGSGSNGFERFKGALKSVGGALSKISQHSGNVSKGVKRVAKSSKSASVSAKGLAKELLRVGKMMKLMITRMILRKIITGVGEGFKNLAQYSKEVNASMSLLWNSFRQLGNSIAASVSPLLNAFAPALNYIIQLVIKAVNAINQLFSALAGFGTWTRAKTLTDDYAKSLDKAGGSAKELKKTVLGFDELNQLQDNSNSGGGGTSPADMFETLEVESKWKNIADKIKSYWQKLINPIKRAWARVGDYVIKSWIKAFDNIKTHILHVADDFLEVWNQPATVHMIEDFFRIIGNIGQIVANLAGSFDRAWQKAEVGKRIFEDIRDIAAKIIGVIEDITLSWALWADKVNFTPLLEGLEGWLDSLKKPIEAVMGVVSDLNDHFIEPFSTWLIETGIPSLINVFADFNNKVDWDAIRERLDKFWKALEPFAETVGEGLIIFIDKVSDVLADFLNSEAWNAFVDTLVKWMQTVDADQIANALWVIFNALIAYKALKFLIACTTALTNFFGLFGVGGTAAGSIETMTTAADAIGGLGGALSGMLMSLGATGHITETFSHVVDDVSNTNERLEQLDKYLVDTQDQTDELSEHLEDLDKYLDDTQDSCTSFSDVLKEIKDYMWGAEGASKDTVDALSDLDKYLIDTSDCAEDMGTTVETETYDMQKAYSDATGAIQGELLTLEQSHNTFFDTIKEIFGVDNWTFDGVMDGLKSTFENAISVVKGIWNGFVGSLNGTHTIFGSTFNINLPKLFANGGFPSQGSMFIAGERGAELVGNINGRTAVANNDQITTGIANAVYAAMVSANGGNGGTRYINNTIQIDGKTIARAVTVGQDKLNRLYSPTMA